MFFIFYRTQIWKLLGFDGARPWLFLPLFFRFWYLVSSFFREYRHNFIFIPIRSWSTKLNCVNSNFNSTFLTIFCSL